MNVYVRELSAALARAGLSCDVYTRAAQPGLPRGGGGRARLPRPPCGRGSRGDRRQGRSSRRWSTSSPRVCASGSARATEPGTHPCQLLAVGRGRPRAQARAGAAARLHVPHACARQGGGLRTRTGAPRSSRVRRDRVQRRDPRVEHRGAGAARAAVRRGARAHRDRAARRRPCLLLPGTTAAAPVPRSVWARSTHPVLLFVGRIQPLKGLDVAVRALAALDDPHAVLLVVGGPERARRRRPSWQRVRELIVELGFDGARALRQPAAASSALELLPRRRRVSGAEPVRVVRARRARGGRVRHAGGGGRGGRAAHTRRSRPHRLSRRRPRPRRVRGIRTRGARQPASGRGDGCRCRGARTGLPLVDHGRRGFAASTPTSPPARWSSAVRRRP